MTTKLKGEAIKENSIPLSALNDEVKDKIENAVVGVDWNAKEGNKGFIKNKPFYQNNKTNGLKSITIGLTPQVIHIRQEYNEVSRLNIYSDSNKTNLLISINISNIEDYDTFEGYYDTIEYNGNNNIHIQLAFDDPYWDCLALYISASMTSEIGEEYITVYYELINDSVKTLEEKYIPKTIVRKSDLDFNPIMLKYTLNPYIIRPNEIIPGLDGAPNDIGYYVFRTGSLQSTLLTMFIVEIRDENHNSTYYKITKVVDDSTNYEDYRISGDFGELRFDYGAGVFTTNN